MRFNLLLLRLHEIRVLEHDFRDTLFVTVEIVLIGRHFHMIRISTRKMDFRQFSAVHQR